MLTVTTRHNRMQVIREKIAQAITPSPELKLELMELEQRDAEALRGLVAQEGWNVLEKSMRDAIAEQKEIVFSLASTDTSEARDERMLRASIAECFSKIIEMVRGEIDRLDYTKRELQQHDQIADHQDSFYSHGTLSRLRERVANNG